MYNKYSYLKKNISIFNQAMNDYGWIIYENAIDDPFIEEIKNGIGADMNGTLHHLVDRQSFSLDFLSRKYCEEEIKNFLSGNYILNSLGAVINLKNESPYVQNIHRDIRSFTGNFKLMIQMMVVLDDFTMENGATYFLSGSHKSDIKPEEEYFFETAERAIVKKGSIILFDSNLWHAAGKNYTNGQRRVLTMAFTRPFFKQQMDYPRLLGYDFGNEISEDLKQILGYNSRLPENLNEYYQPVQKRMYQPNQG